MIFDGWTLSFLSSSLSRKKLEIFKRIIEKNGGKVQDIPACDLDMMVHFSQRPKHALLADPQCKDLHYLFEDCHRSTEAQIGEIVVNSTDWVSDSVKESKLKDLEKYRINTIRTKRSNHEIKDVGSLLDPSFNNSKYECFRPTPLDHANKGLVAELSKIAHHRYLTGNARSELSYNRAIAALKAYPRDVKSGEEAALIRGIGPKIVGLVEEYLETGRVEVAREVQNSEQLTVLDRFTRIHGVGPKIAQHWYDLGLKSLEDLEEAASQGIIKLQQDQIIGIKYYEDFQKPILRKEVEQILQIVQKHSTGMFGDSVLVEMTGGYRRGKLLSGDADILIHPVRKGAGKGDILEKLVKALKDAGYIKDILSISKSSSSGKGKAKKIDGLDLCFMAFKPTSDSPMHRVDLIVSSQEAYPFAQLGWTGSRQFERSIRLFCSRERGLTLTDHGLTMAGNGQEVGEFAEERDIFEFLGVPYQEPSKRNC